MVIRVENLGKRYRIGGPREAYGTLRDTIASAVQAPLRILSDRHRKDGAGEFWALKEVSFSVEQGEVLGIIGPNGAGKSTLLKILARVTYPTEGRARISGRVASLLDVGTGFHPELTGRENIYLNGAVLGMRRTEIQRKFDEIVEFAEVQQFLDTPVKRYSSGMYMRLAFAVAAHLEPEILVVDEVLAVGDAAFQKRCLGKMGSSATQGKTVLFVSHNMVALEALCNRAIWLEHGRIKAEGQPSQVVSMYLQTAAPGLTGRAWAGGETPPGNDVVRLKSACVRAVGGVPSDPITMRTPVVLEFEYWNLVPNTCLHLNLQLITQEGILAFASNPSDQSGWHGDPLPVGLFHSECHIPGDLLRAGQYRVRLLVIKDNYYLLYEHDDLLVFDVQDCPELRRGWYGEMVGAVRPLLKWRTEIIESNLQDFTGSEAQGSSAGQ